MYYSYIVKQLKSTFKTASMLAVFLLIAGAAQAQLGISGPTEGCSDIAYTFTATGASGITNLSWSDGVGGSATNQNNFGVKKVTASKLVLTITLTGKDGSGATVSASQTFTVYPPPTAILSTNSSKTQCIEGNSFTFTNQSKSNTNVAGSKIVTSEWLYDDGGGSVESDPNATVNVTHSYTTTPDSSKDQTYDITLRVTDDKGCVTTLVMPNYVTVKKPMGILFYSNKPQGCDSQFVKLTNISKISFDSLKSFRWEFLDNGTSISVTSDGCNSAKWDSVTRWMSANGCFNARLYAESKIGCRDTFETQQGCNRVVLFNIAYPMGDNVCYSENGRSGVNFTASPLPGTFTSFAWVFDDPDSGPQNVNTITLSPNHQFTKVDFYRPRLIFQVPGCGQRDTSIALFIKGPQASIESKPGNIDFYNACNLDMIPLNQRYQCQITDTVFFPNHSTYFFNDGDPFNDTVKTGLPCFDDTCLNAGKNGFTVPGYMAGDRKASCDALVKPAIIQGSIPKYKDTVLIIPIPKRNPNCPQAYDTVRTQVLRPFVDSAIAVNGNIQKYITRRNSHTTRVWDFDDDEAPRCTTDSRPIYPKLAKYNNLHLVGPVGNFYPKNTYAPKTYTKAQVVDSTKVEIIKPLTNPDTINKYKYVLVKNVTKSGTNNSISTTQFVKDGIPIDTLITEIKVKVDTVGQTTVTEMKWVNCRYSNDSLPKHWYSPSKPQCYSVKLILYDSSRPDTNILSIVTAKVDPNCGDTAQIQLALMPPDASGLQIRASTAYCFDYPTIYGVALSFNRTKPACDRQHFWVHWDSAFDRNDATPNEFDNWIFETGTTIGQNFFPPWPLATLGLPPNVGNIWNQYFSGGTYPTGIFSRDGWVTVGFRVQNGINPATGQACVDEKWYNRAYRYLTTNDNFYFFKPEKPDSTFLYNVGCPPEEVFVLRDTNFLVQDSIVAQSWAWGDTTSTIDSFYRWDCNAIPGKCIGYMKTYEIDNRIGKQEVVDSVVFRIYNQTTGLNELLLPLDSIAPTTRSHVYKSMARFIVTHQMVACQKIEEDVNGKTVIKKSCCDRTRTGRVNVMGYLNGLNVSDTVVCKGTPVQFFDSARYYWLIPPQGCNDVFNWDYWLDPKKQGDFNTFQPCDIFPDTLPRNTPAKPYRYEQTKYNFGDGTGWREPGTVPDNPTYIYSKPGMYNAQIEYTDSVGCKATYTQRVWVTGVMADFGYTKGLNACQPIATFFDSSIMFDACQIELGFPCDIVTYKKWWFGDGNVSLLMDDSVQNLYDKFGEYDIKLYVETGLGCKDSIVRNIILEGPQPQFDFAIDSIGCNPYTVEVRNLSKFPSPNAKWTWFWGDGSNSPTDRDTNMRHTYDSAGTYVIYLLQNDISPIPPSTPCDIMYPDTSDTNAREFKVRVIEYKKVQIFASDTIICPKDSIVIGITDSTDGIYSTFNWDMGNGTAFNGKGRESDTIKYAYPTPGTYYVRLTPTYVPPLGDPMCPLFDYQKIEVKEVNAEFRTDTLKLRAPEFYFENQSTNAVEYWWNFDNGEGWIKCGDLDDCPNARVNYGDKTGTYNVCLVAKSADGCLDTACHPVENKFTYHIDIPNVFTPGDNVDGKNDVFDIDIYNQEYYDLKIYNRWGELVFESTDANVDWNGKKFNTGADCPSGTYYVVLNYKLRSQKDNTYRGSLTLLRSK